MTYKERQKIAKQDAKKTDKKGVELAEELYKKGHSIRIISELTDIPRSTLQRYLSENHIRNLNDARTKRLIRNLHKTEELYQEGYDKEEIAEMMKINITTATMYLKQLGYMKNTKFKCQMEE